MLDSDLPNLYNCKNGTKSINLAVKRHINRFPERFRFQLTDDELNKLRFQIETANNMSRSLPYVFTEQGVAMLATVLRTDVAETVSIQIMDAFVKMRHQLNNTLLQTEFIEHKLLEHDKRIDVFVNIFNNFKDKSHHIFFKNQIYDAYSLLVNILNAAIKEIIIIDNYIDKIFLDICSETNKNVVIFTNKVNQMDLERYNKQFLVQVLRI